MDITFRCPTCNQELAADETLAGSEIDCPSCNNKIGIPAPAGGVPVSTHTPAKEEKHFVVPVHEQPVEALIRKPRPPLEFAKDGDKKMRIRCIKRTECVEVGKDHFEEIVTDFLGKVGDANVVSINTIYYSTIDMGSRQILMD
ncbi:MAG TPA: hypothetical protein VHH73_10115, partial [Verrucomicrobiae bacterium]|nr:hypothetical protein [Verrucomicrobiae bacterium]